MANGQAEQAPATEGLADLASYLSDTPEEESNDENEAETVEELASEETTDEPTNDDSDEPANEGDDETPEDAEDETAPVEKITFKVKGENGEEETIEATPDEVASSYMRQKDYTKKTQALAERENQAVEFFRTKHEEIRNQYLSQAELSRAAVAQMAGIRTEDEMAELAKSDPASWVAESQRQRQISNFLSQLDQQITGEKQQADQQAKQQAEQRKMQMFETSWAELQKEGIDKPKLAKIYEGVNKNYGFSQEELAGVLDHRMVQVMRDAMAFRELKAQKAAVTKKVQEAPRMPSRQATPAQDRRDREMDAKFKSGRAKLNDLAAYLR